MEPMYIHLSLLASCRSRCRPASPTSAVAATTCRLESRTRCRRTKINGELIKVLSEDGGVMRARQVCQQIVLARLGEHDPIAAYGSGQLLQALGIA